jgi:hypothetical protein
VDETGHRREHSLEVQLPFLQYLKKDISLVPVCVSYLADYRDLEELARAIAAEVQVRLTPEDQARLARARTAKPRRLKRILGVALPAALVRRMPRHPQ